MRQEPDAFPSAAQWPPGAARRDQPAEPGGYRGGAILAGLRVFVDLGQRAGGWTGAVARGLIARLRAMGAEVDPPAEPSVPTGARVRCDVLVRLSLADPDMSIPRGVKIGYSLLQLISGRLAARRLRQAARATGVAEPATGLGWLTFPPPRACYPAVSLAVTWETRLTAASSPDQWAEALAVGVATYLLDVAERPWVGDVFIRAPAASATGAALPERHAAGGGAAEVAEPGGRQELDEGSEVGMGPPIADLDPGLTAHGTDPGGPETDRGGDPDPVAPAAALQEAESPHAADPVQTGTDVGGVAGDDGLSERPAATGATEDQERHDGDLEDREPLAGEDSSAWGPPGAEPAARESEGAGASLLADDAAAPPAADGDVSPFPLGAELDGVREQGRTPRSGSDADALDDVPPATEPESLAWIVEEAEPMRGYRADAAELGGEMVPAAGPLRRMPARVPGVAPVASVESSVGQPVGFRILPAWYRPLLGPNATYVFIPDARSQQVATPPSVVEAAVLYKHRPGSRVVRHR